MGPGLPPTCASAEAFRAAPRRAADLPAQFATTTSKGAEPRCRSAVSALTTIPPQKALHVAHG